MANAKTLVVGGQPLNVIDDTARSNAQTALNNAEYNRQGQIGKYGGQSIAAILAGEIGSGSVYDALHKRIAAANFAGLRVGDYLDVPLVSASAVTTQQSVRFLLAHIDPYLYCGDNSKGHHIAFVASAPIAVAKTVTGVANDSFLMWNTANTNQGTADQKCPYPNSNLKAWETAFEACLPESLTKYLLTQRVLLEERYSASGALNDSNSWSWQDIGKVFSLSEMEVYGCPVWGTKGYSVGFDCQWDLFRDTAHRVNGNRCNWWLRSVMGGSASHVCYVNDNGHAIYSSATHVWVRPPRLPRRLASQVLYTLLLGDRLARSPLAREAGRFFRQFPQEVHVSGVYQRNREVSEYKFFTQAIAIRVEVNKLMASSSVVPKAYRLLNAVPTVETARSIVCNVNRADCFYPNTSFNALERKRYLTLAIADCEQLMLDMQCLMDIGLPVNANRFEELAAMVEEEIRLLKGARKNVRVTGKKSTEERIAEAEAELERLRSL